MRHQTAKIAGTALLSVLAAIAAVRCAASFRAVQEKPVVSYDGMRAEFVLRNWKGYVSVFSPDGGHEPVQITGIETDSLRADDRKLLESGLSVGTREHLLLLLEDLGN